MTIPLELALSGKVYPSKQSIPSVGDVAITPGAGRTPYIDAAIFDGSSWRLLDLNGFGYNRQSRVFNHSSEIGSLMRKIEQSIIKCKGLPVYYDFPFGSKKRKFIFRGIPFSYLRQAPTNPWGFR